MNANGEGAKNGAARGEERFVGAVRRSRARQGELAVRGEPPGPHANILDSLCAIDEADGRRDLELPSRSAVAGIVDDLRAVLYPRHFGGAGLVGRSRRGAMSVRLAKAHRALLEQVRRGVSFECASPGSHEFCAHCAARAEHVARALVQRLPALRELIDRDVLAAFEGDPAARHLDEALFCYPGVQAILQHRIAHELYQLAVPLIPRIISELAHSSTGIDIHPGARIGASFFIDHGTGVVIGETCSIGERVRLYQGVTLGARSFVSDDQGKLIKGLHRHPVVEDDVVIYAGATILGRVTIGRGAVIGGNVWLTRSVPPGSRVIQPQARRETFENGSGI